MQRQKSTASTLPPQCSCSHMSEQVSVLMNLQLTCNFTIPTHADISHFNCVSLKYNTRLLSRRWSPTSPKCRKIYNPN